MQKSFVRKGVVFLTAVLLIFAIFNICADNAYADTANITISGGGTFEKRDTVTITLKYTGADFGSATANVTYDPDVLEYVSCSGAEAGGSGGTVKLTMANGSGASSLSCKLTFKAKKVGKTTVQVSTVDIYNFDMEELSAGSKATIVTVKDSSDKVSTNANLSELYISAGKLSPAFSRDVTSYTVEVDNSVTEFLLTAVKEDSRATTKVTGSKEMKVGENIRKVTVTAESGKTKTYTITIIRAKGADDVQEPDDIQKPSDTTQNQENKPVMPDAIEAVVKDVTYIVEEELTKVKIPETFAISAANYNDKQIPVVKDHSGKITLAYLKDQETSEGGWYFYSEKQNQFYTQKYLTSEQLFAYGDSRVEEAGIKAGTEDGESNGTDADASGKGLISTTEVMLMIFGATLGLLLLVVICLQISIIKDRKR